MDIRDYIADYATQPITHQLLTSILKDYKRPNDKIKALRAHGFLQSLKKGLYVAGPNIRSSKPENRLLANHIYGPSYVSMDTALAYYGLIPERVYEVASMTMKPSKTFHTPLGTFSYTHLPLPYYAFGLHMTRLSDTQRAIIASPEKALCDKIIATSGIQLRSTVQARDYLVDDLRMDETALRGLDLAAIRSWMDEAPKKDSLQILIKTIESL
jgi:hypothetical protein